MYPYRAIGLKGRVQGIASQKDKPPVPKENDGKFGKYYTFTVLIEVTSDGAKGAIVPYSLPYNFGSDEDNLVCYNSWGKNSKRLDAFLTAAGAWDHVPDPFPYRDNILPILQKAMLHAGRELVFQIKDGWVVAESIDTLSSDSWDDEDDFGDEEDFAPEVEEDAPADDESFEDDSEEDDFEDASDEDFEWD